MPQWKTISQRNFLKGLQATYSLFSQPGAILTRLSNMLYDRRGGVRTTDGSAQIATSSIGAGVIADFALYQPPGVGAYYVGIQRQTAEQVTAPSGLTLTAMQVGGAISSITRAGGIVTLITAAAHNLSALAPLNGLTFSPGNLVVAGTGTDLDTNVPFDRVTVVSATEISYANSGAARTAATGTLGTNLAPGTYTYSVTACDGIGGETPASPTATIVLTAPNNAVQMTWNGGPFAALFSVYGVAGKVGRLNPGIGGAQSIAGATFIDIGLLSNVNATPPATNTTQSTIIYRLDPPNAIETLANLPPFPIPPLGGIPGAYGPEQPGANIGGGPTAQGGVIGLLGPLPQMAQFTGRLALALGNGYAPQQYSDKALTVNQSNTSNAGNLVVNPSTWDLISGQYRSQFNPGTSSLGDFLALGSGGNIPSNATIVGVVVSFSVVAQAATTGTVNEVALWHSGALLGTAKTPATPINTVPTAVSYGNGADLWGAALTPAIVNDPTFGFALSCTCDSIRVFVSGPYPVQIAYTVPESTGFEPITNAFTAQYPDWQASVAWNAGDQILDSVSGGVLQAQQSGTSGTARPTFVNTLNATTADNTIIWVCTITKITPTPLRAAAHALVYAGSLWIANTWPSSTSDLLDGPNVLKMSDVNTLASWNPLNIAFIAKDDGDQITGLGTFTIAESGISPTGSMVIFKNFTTYQVTGVFGATDFAIQQAQTDLGCVASRTIQFVPGFGLMRLTHLGFAYFNGVADKLESEPIRPYLFGGVGNIAPIDWNYAWFSKGAQCANPPMYVCAVPVQAPALNGVTIASPGPGFEVEMYARVTQLTLDADGNYEETAITPEVQVTGATAAIVVTTPAAQPNVFYRAYIGLVPGGENAYTQAASFTATNLTYAAMTPGLPTIGNGALKRLICYDLVQRAWAVLDLPFPVSAVKQIRAPGTIPLTLAGGFSDSIFRRMFAGDVAWDTGAAVIWSFDGSELFQEGGSGKVFYRRLSVRGEINGTATVQLAITLGGVTGPTVTAQQNNLGANQFLFRVDIMKDALNAHATVSGTGPVTIDSLDWQVKPKPAGAAISIQK